MAMVKILGLGMAAISTPVFGYAAMNEDVTTYDNKELYQSQEMINIAEELKNELLVSTISSSGEAIELNIYEEDINNVLYYAFVENLEYDENRVANLTNLWIELENDTLILNATVEFTKIPLSTVLSIEFEVTTEGENIVLLFDKVKVGKLPFPVKLFTNTIDILAQTAGIDLQTKIDETLEGGLDDSFNLKEARYTVSLESLNGLHGINNISLENIGINENSIYITVSSLAVAEIQDAIDTSVTRINDEVDAQLATDIQSVIDQAKTDPTAITEEDIINIVDQIEALDETEQESLTTIITESIAEIDFSSLL